MLQNTVQCTGLLSTTKNFLDPNVNRAESEKAQAMVMNQGLRATLGNPREAKSPVLGHLVEGSFCVLPTPGSP